MNVFMEEFLPHIQLLTGTLIIYVHLLALIMGGGGGGGGWGGWKRGLALQVAVHNMPRLIPTRIHHATLYVSPDEQSTPD